MVTLTKRSTAGLLLVSLACRAATAQPGTVSSYSVTHNYVFTTPGGLPPISLFNYAVSARAFEPAPGWDNRVASGNWGIFGPGAFGISRRAGTDRPAPGFFDAGATASVSAVVNNWGGGVYSASMNSSGTAHARFAPPNRAMASSRLNTQIFAPWGWRFGRLAWRPIISDSVSGSASIVRNRRWDPINFRILDASGAQMESGSFFDVFLEWTPSGDAGFEWNDAGLTAGPLSEMFLRIDMPPNPFTTMSGQLEFSVVGGLVTQSIATGFFGGFGLPALGSNVSGGLNLPNFGNHFEFDYDFSNVPNGANVEFDLDGGGETDVVPGPGVLVLAGMALLVPRRRRA